MQKNLVNMKRSGEVIVKRQTFTNITCIWILMKERNERMVIQSCLLLNADMIGLISTLKGICFHKKWKKCTITLGDIWQEDWESFLELLFV